MSSVTVAGEPVRSPLSALFQKKIEGRHRCFRALVYVAKWSHFTINGGVTMSFGHADIRVRRAIL